MKRKEGQVVIGRDEIHVSTGGRGEMVDITELLRQSLQKSGLSCGSVLLFVPGSTAALTTIEYEPGLLCDFPELMEKLIPSDRAYHHDLTWHDGNGFSHLRASLLKPSLTIPFWDRELTLGTWQQVILVDFDNRPRKRRVIVQYTGI